jgi:hypothetical protein
MRVRARCCLAAAFATALLASGCGDDNGSKPHDEDINTLVFTRADSTAIAFAAGSRTYAWCGAWEPGSIDVPALHVWFGSGSTEHSAGWWLRAVVADIAVGDTLSFPNTFVWNEPDSVDVFVWDPPNELSTSEEESSGFVVFQEIPCPDGDRVAFTLDAVIGSEFGGSPAVSVRGRVEADVTDPLWQDAPRWPARGRLPR